VVLNHLGDQLRDANTSTDELDNARDALVAFGANTAAQEFVAKLLTDTRLGEKQTIIVLDAVERIRLKDLPQSWSRSVGELVRSPHPNIRARTLDLIRSRSLPGFDEELAKIAADSGTPDQLRATALDILVARHPRLTGEQYAFLTSRLSPDSDAVLRQTAARVIGRSTPDRGQLLAIAREQLPMADPLTLSTILDGFRSSKDEEVGQALVSVLRKSPSVLGTLGEDRLKTLLAGYPEPVQAASKPLFQQLQNAQRERIERLERLEPLLTAGGDVGRGRRIFFGEKVACSSCHTIGLEGKQVGPDLTGIGAIRSGHDLLEAIVFPSASFVPGHEVYNVDTETERLSGVMKSQSKEAVVLITGPNGEVRIPRGIVKSVTPSKVSLMPEGFDEQLTRAELTDLLAFLQAERTQPQSVAAR
jgi:putative heme-binding domain-containing protein